MKLIRKDKIAYVTSASRDKIKLSLPKKAQIDALKLYAKAHNGEYAITYVIGEYRYMAFSSARGYSLGAAVIDYFGDTGKYVWTDRVNDTDDYVFVCVDNGSIVHEIVVENQNIERYLLASFFDKDELPKVITSTTLPEFLINFLDSFEELRAVEQETRKDYILDCLPHNKSYLYKEVAVLEGLLDSSEKQGNAKAISFAVLAAVVGCFFIFSGEEEPQDPSALVDPFEGYNNLLKIPSAAGTLASVYEALKKIEGSQFWVLQKCEMAENMPLICEYKPTYTARTEDLERLEHLIGSNSKASLKGGMAHLVIGITPTPNRRQHQIARLEETAKSVYDNLRVDDSFNNYDFMPPVSAPNWLTQNVKVSSENAGIYSLIILADAMNGLPVNLQSVNINTSERGFIFQYSLTIFGGK